MDEQPINNDYQEFLVELLQLMADGNLNVTRLNAFLEHNSGKLNENLAETLPVWAAQRLERAAQEDRVAIGIFLATMVISIDQLPVGKRQGKIEVIITAGKFASFILTAIWRCMHICKPYNLAAINVLHLINHYWAIARISCVLIPGYFFVVVLST